jgi:hypothetical protein
MTAWQDRSPIRAAYLNPALVTALVAAACQGYNATRSEAMAWPLAFIAAPLVLHRPTRDSLPQTTATRLTAWIGGNAALQAGFPARAKALAPTVREGLRFGLRHRALTLGPDGLTSAISVRLGGDADIITAKARFVGRWFGRSGDTATIFGLLGVEP